MKTNNYVISLLAAMMIVSQSPVVINANNVTNYQYDSIGNIVKQNESLQADIFNVDFSDGPNNLSPLQNELGKTIGNPKIIESDELHKNIAKFDGSSAYLYPFNQEKYQKINRTVTMECMVKFNSIPSGEHDIFSNQQSGGIGLGLDNGKLTFFAHVGGSYRQLVSTVKVGQWYHIVGVVDGKEVKLYVNGQLQSTVTAPNPGIKYPSSSGAWNMVLGADSDSSNGAQAYTNADLSFARIYSNALSDDDIAYLSDKAFAGADIEELKPQDINLGLIGSEGISENGQWNLNIHANEVKVGSIDKIEYDLVYDSDALNYEGV